MRTTPNCTKRDAASVGFFPKKLNKQFSPISPRSTLSEDRGFQKRKTDLEERLLRLEEERTALIAQVESLRERRTILDLQKKAESLQETVDILKREKMSLEGEVASLEGGQGR